MKNEMLAVMSALLLTAAPAVALADAPLAERIARAQRTLQQLDGLAEGEAAAPETLLAQHHHHHHHRRHWNQWQQFRQHRPHHHHHHR